MSESWNTAVELEPERYEFFEDRGYRFDLDRRGFLKSLGGGILVLHLLHSVRAEQAPGSTLAKTARSPFTRVRRRSVRTSARR
jgi:hypothetical protein